MSKIAHPKHWQDGVNAVLGAWLLLSPWAVGYADERVATANAVVVGLALAAGALGAILVPRAWEEWAEAVVGAWLVVSPWVLGFAGQTDARMSAASIGAVVVALALWTIASDKDLQTWRRERAAQTPPA
jgi:hypothetical protein